MKIPLWYGGVLFDFFNVFWYLYQLWKINSTSYSAHVLKYIGKNEQDGPNFISTDFDGESLSINMTHLRYCLPLSSPTSEYRDNNKRIKLSEKK